MRQLKPIEAVPPIRRDMDIMANRLPSTRILAGKELELVFDHGGHMSIALEDDVLKWRAEDGSTITGEDRYDAVEMRPGICFLDFATADGRRAFSHVLDLEAGRALTVRSDIIETGGRRDLIETLSPAWISGDYGSYEPIAETRELLGKRLFCEYSPEAALEHIYVNSRTIVWQWLRSPDELTELKTEVGIEALSMWKIRDRLYLISTREQGPIQLTLLMDLQQYRNVGRLFGISRFGTVDRRCGAKITFLGEISYSAGYEPG